jgi:GxxExxY protein
MGLIHKELAYAVVGAAMEVHNVLGPGFLESVYQRSLSKELNLRNIPHVQLVKLPVSYKGESVGIYEADIVVNEKIILELKAMSSDFHTRHMGQALNYLSATGYQLALLINFGRPSLVYKRIVR